MCVCLSAAGGGGGADPGKTHDAGGGGGGGGAAPGAPLRSQQSDLFKCDDDPAVKINLCRESPSPPSPLGGHMMLRRPLQAESETAPRNM